jgi:predicted enzyme related to lactoylglutathione lyase
MNSVSSVNIFARDPGKLAAFYSALFGLVEKTELRSPIYRALEAGGIMIAFNAFEAYALMKLGDYSDTKGVKSLLTFEVASADEVARITEAAVAQGARLVKGPYDTAYGSRQSVLFDPEDNVFRINAF